MGRLKREEWDRRVGRAEELLIQMPTSGGVVSALRAEFGVGSSSAWRYLREARRRRAIEVAELDAESRGAREAERQGMRRTVRHILSRAFKEGKLGVALAATKQLRELDGLDLPRERQVSAAFGVDAGSSFGHRSTAHLIAFLRTGRLPPDDGADQLGGDQASQPVDDVRCI